MTRTKTAWWSVLFPTPPLHLLRRQSGKRLIDVLTEWWMALEGFTDGTWPTADHSRSAADDRYTRTTFYARLDSVGFPVLADGDERAMDKIFDAFQMWTRSREARKLIARLADDLGHDLTRAADPDTGSRIQHNVHHAVHHQVHEHVAHQVHQHVHAQVHHAVSHAAHGVGHSGGGHAGGGLGGGHH